MPSSSIPSWPVASCVSPGSTDVAHHGFLIPGVLRPNIPDYGRALVSQMAGNANGTREVLSNGRVIDTPVGASGLPTLSVVPAWASFTDRIARSNWNYIATGIWTGDTGTAPYGLRVHTRRGILNIPRSSRTSSYATPINRVTVTPNFSGAFARVEVTSAENSAQTSINQVVPGGVVSWACIEIAAGSETTCEVGIYRSAFASPFTNTVVSGPGTISNTARVIVSGLTSSPTVVSTSSISSVAADRVIFYPKSTVGVLGASNLIRSVAMCAGIPDRPALFHLWTAPINVVYDNYCRVFLYPEDLF